MKKPNTRKCSICKIDIFIETEEFVPEKKSEDSNVFTYAHKSCMYEKFKQYYSEEYMDNYSKECMEKYNKYQSDKKIKALRKKEEKRKYSKEAKDDLCQYLFATYGITVLSNYFYVYLDGIMSGSSKKIGRPVPPEDLLDMFKKKQAYLDRVCDEKDKKIDEKMKPENRIKYSIAILLKKYDSYLDWKNKQKLAITEDAERKEEIKESVDYSMIGKAKSCFENGVDIASMLDEI